MMLDYTLENLMEDDRFLWLFWKKETSSRINKFINNTSLLSEKDILMLELSHGLNMVEVRNPKTVSGDVFYQLRRIRQKRDGLFKIKKR